MDILKNIPSLKLSPENQYLLTILILTLVLVLLVSSYIFLLKNAIILEGQLPQSRILYRSFEGK